MQAALVRTFDQIAHCRPWPCRLAASRGQRGRSDFVDALLVGVDILNKEVEERSESATASKRIVLISGFLHAAGEDPGGEIVEGLAQAITHHGAKLQVISLDIPEQDAAHARAKNANSVLLDALLSHVDHSVHSVTHAPELIGALPAKEYASVATLSGKLDIGTELHISVKLATKTMQEKFPGLGKEAPPVAEGMGSDLEPTTVVSTTEYYRQDDPDKKAVPLEDRTKAYRVSGMPWSGLLGGQRGSAQEAPSVQ